MYAALARAVLDDTGRNRAAFRVERLRRLHPRESTERLAARVIRRAAMECGSGGALMTGTAAFFGAKPFGAGLTWQLLALNRLVLALGVLYRDDASGQGRMKGMAAGVAAGLSAEILRQALVPLLGRVLPRRSGARSVAGALAGAALGYGAALAVGRVTQDALRGHRLPWPRR